MIAVELTVLVSSTGECGQRPRFMCLALCFLALGDHLSLVRGSLDGEGAARCTARDIQVEGLHLLHQILVLSFYHFVLVPD